MDDPTTLELVGRIALAALLGAVLGAEREISMKTAGLRTHTLVAAGAGLFAIAGAYTFDSVGTDKTRVAAQIVTGIGFIGAGGLLRAGFTVTGITTAATLWFAAALGLAAGFGMYVVAPAALGVALVATIGLAPIRRYMRHSRVYPLQIDYRPGYGTLTPLFDVVNAVGGTVASMSMQEEAGTRRLVVELGNIGRENLSEIISQLGERDEVIAIEPPPGFTP